tara:strand:+ start:1942 stop:2154 length:213 start_codon:yes stop_codon:yes gene_type:complete
MAEKAKKGSYKFIIKGKEYEVFFAEEDEQIEIYEIENAGKTGFIFDDHKQFVLFINNITDIAELEMNEED